MAKTLWKTLWKHCEKHGLKAVDLIFQKFKNINLFFPSCQASDFWGHLRTDFLNDQRLRHTNQTAGDLQLQFHISQLKQIFNCILTWRDNISLSCLNTELLSWCNCIKRAKQIKQKTSWLQQEQLYILQMKHIWHTHEDWRGIV